MLKKLLYLTLIVSFLCTLCSCQKEESENHVFPAKDLLGKGSYTGEYWPTNEWKSCSPEAVGMDSELLMSMNDYIVELLGNDYNINTVLVIRKGYIVAEQSYSKYFDKDIKHKIFSCTKSITSSLIGIAINEGYLTGVDQKVLDLFPEYDISDPYGNKKNITIEHLLTMSAGFEWYELDYPYTDQRNTHNEWMQNSDRVKYLLDRPMALNPGTRQNYNSGLSHVLSAIIQKTTGLRTDSFAIDKLFTPIGISDFYWPTDPNGISTGSGSIRMTPRNMARFGYLYLKNGNWDGNQIVPEDWVTESSKKHFSFWHVDNYYYGYQWWITSFDTYAAVGYQGQWIIVVPDKDMVVVFTNIFDEGDGAQWDTPEHLLRTYIIPAVLEK